MKKLDFSSLVLYGRSEEFDVLMEAYNRVGVEKSEIVLVSGFAGTGKSSLIQKLRESSDSQYFCSGKFSQIQAAEPYLALSEALNELCDSMKRAPKDEKYRAVASFKRAVGSKGNVLLNVCPKLAELLGDKEHSDLNAGGTTVAMNQLKFVLRTFMRLVCSVAQTPVVLVFDDLQWVDNSSLSLISSILNDSKSSNMLFIGSYRDNEVSESHPFAVKLRDFEEEKPVTHVRLGNLDVDTVNELISDLTEMERASTVPLATVVHKKTNGNIFFVLQFLRLLQEEGFLYFSMTSYKWMWDMDKIRFETNLADNVVDLVAVKIQSMPPKTQIAMELAACLWSTFDAEIVREILLKGRSGNCSTIVTEDVLISESDDLFELLDHAAKEGLLDKLAGTSMYKFSHDRIQQATLTLLPKGHDGSQLQLWIGKLLLEMTATPRCEEWMFFAAAEQLNKGSELVIDETDRIKLAKFNLDVGQKAMALSAFVPAAAYLKSGIDYLSQGKQWEEHYALTLKLHILLAETEYCTGGVDCVKMVAEEVFTHACSLEDTIAVSVTLCRTLMACNRINEALDVCHDVLRKLGEPLPRKPGRATGALEFYEFKRMMKGKSDEELLRLPLLRDEKKKAATEFFNLVHIATLKQTSLVVVKMLKMSLRFGVCELSPLYFAHWGGFLVGEGDIKGGYRFGQLSLKLADRFDSVVRKNSATWYCNVFLIHWQEPLQQCLEPILDAHDVFMVNGYIAEACETVIGYMQLYFYGGLPLAPGAEDLMSFSRLMLEYNHQAIRQFLLPVLQTILNLMGRSKDVLRLTGEAMRQEEYENLDKNPKQCGVQSIWSCRMQLAYYFDDIDLAADMSNRLQKEAKVDVFSASYFICTRKMFFALIEIALARKTKRNKHAAMAAKIIQQMETEWVKQGAVNVVHKLQLLKAEYASLKSAKPAAKEAFKKAVSLARRSGFTQDEALANERAGIYFLQLGDDNWASWYLTRAHELYGEWGAKAKVEQLQGKYESLLTEQKKIHSSHVKGQSRFTDKTSMSHRKLPANQLVG